MPEKCVPLTPVFGYQLFTSVCQFMRSSSVKVKKVARVIIKIYARSDDEESENVKIKGF